MALESNGRALEGRPEGVMASGGWYGDYGNIGWNTWLHLRDYEAGPLLEEYSTWEQYNAQTGNTLHIHWLRLLALGERTVLSRKLATIPRVIPLGGSISAR